MPTTAGRWIALDDQGRTDTQRRQQDPERRALRRRLDDAVARDVAATGLPLALACGAITALLAGLTADGQTLLLGTLASVALGLQVWMDRQRRSPPLHLPPHGPDAAAAPAQTASPGETAPAPTSSPPPAVSRHRGRLQRRATQALRTLALPLLAAALMGGLLTRAPAAVAPWAAWLTLLGLLPLLPCLSARLTLALPWAMVVAAAAAGLTPSRWPAGAASTTALIPAASWPEGAPALLALAMLLAWLHRQRRRTLLQRLREHDALQTARRAWQAAERTDRDKSRFLAIASHDLRQPVHALGLFAATLARRLKHGEDESLGRHLLQAVDALERSFNALLDLSRLDAGAVSARPETFALRDLFHRLYLQYAGQAELAGLQLRFAPGGRWVHGDPQLLERMIGNLVHNALKHTHAGGIAVLARGHGARVHIEVWDSGCGIAESDLPRVFDEFYQVRQPTRDRRQGLGMGLAIVQRLARLQGHGLMVASRPGQGSLFRISVPRGGMDGLEQALGAADTRPMQLDASRRVLVVDDEAPIREGLRVLLQEWGLQVLTARDADDAEHAVRTLDGRIDLVITDLHLGDGDDGRALVARLRRLCEPRLPALIISGDAPAVQRSLSAAGAAGAMPDHAHGPSADPMLLKPVQPQHLFEALQAALS